MTLVLVLIPLMHPYPLLFPLQVPRTLLVRFADDSIDETPEMERLLRPRVGSRGEGGGRGDYVGKMSLTRRHG